MIPFQRLQASGNGQDFVKIRVFGSWSATMASDMSDPLSLLAERFRPAFSSVAGAPADPVVRASDRADAQVNGALAVAKAMGKVPRDVATEVLAILGDVSDMCESTEVAGPGFINVVFSRAFLERELATMTSSSTLGVRGIEG